MAITSFRLGDEVTLTDDESSYDLYQALGKVPAGARIYIEAENGYALRVVRARRDKDGDVILVALSAPETRPVVKVG